MPPVRDWGLSWCLHRQIYIYRLNFVCKNLESDTVTSPRLEFKLVFAKANYLYRLNINCKNLESDTVTTPRVGFWWVLV